MNIERIKGLQSISLAFDLEEMSQILILDQEEDRLLTLSRHRLLFKRDIFSHDFLINSHSDHEEESIFSYIYSPNFINV